MKVQMQCWLAATAQNLKKMALLALLNGLLSIVKAACERYLRRETLPERECRGISKNIAIATCGR